TPPHAIRLPYTTLIRSQLRVGRRRHAGSHALYRGADVAHRARDPIRPGQGNGRLYRELRRYGVGAVGHADADSEPARQWLLRYRSEEHTSELQSRENLV